MKIKKEKLAIIFGALSLFLFSAKPYILDLIEPAKSIGEVIGENAKHLVESFNGEKEAGTSNSKRDVWKNIITILAFISLIAGLMSSVSSIQKKKSKWYGICGFLLSLLAIGVYISHLAIGLVGLVVIAVLAVLFVMTGEVS